MNDTSYEVLPIYAFFSQRDATSEIVMATNHLEKAIKRILNPLPAKFDEYCVQRVLKR